MNVKPCNTCRYLVKGKCTLFIVPVNKIKNIEYVDSVHARKNKSLCGPEGQYHKEYPSEPSSIQILYLSCFNEEDYYR